VSVFSVDRKLGEAWDILGPGLEACGGGGGGGGGGENS
jgi:hypothetical protein